MLNLHSTLDFALLQKDFPFLKEKNRGKPLIYLDSSSSAQKPRQVVDAMSHFYFHGYANIHRGIYELSERASEIYEATRKQTQHFIGARCAEEIIFVRGATEGINLAAASLSHTYKWQAGDEVIVSGMEHHSNLVPWYLLKEKLGIQLKIIPVNDDGSLDIDTYKSLFSKRTRLVAICHASNVLGTINPIKELTAIAHEHDAYVLVDGAQAAPHMAINVKELDCDFYVFSAHKLYGPTGIGILYGKQSLLNEMQPYHGGGGMIETVDFSQVTFTKAPHKFEAGTPNIAGTIGLGAAIKYIESIGMDAIFSHEQDLLAYAENKLLAIDGLRYIGHTTPKLGVISLVMNAIHAHDIGTVLDHEGIAIRAGHHCAMPLMQRFNVPATVRVSFGIYNENKDIDALVEALHLAKRLFA